jgi:hypothetical protein
VARLPKDSRIDMSHLVMQVNLRTPKLFWVRMKIAGLLLGIVAWILGCQIDINEEK